MELAKITQFGTKVLGDKGTRAIGRSVLSVRRYSPEILTATGIIGGVTAGVLGARATLKLEDRLDAMRRDIDLVKDRQVEMNDFGQPVYTPSEVQKELVRAYAKGTLEVTKLYAPTVGLAVGSIVCILAAHGIMHRRQVALIAAYKTVEEGFNAYRKRVIDEFGLDKDRDYIAGTVTTEETDEQGNVTKVVTHLDPNGHSQYARFFDQTSQYWQREPEYNLTYLRSRQNYFNNMLHAKGYVFLNEVYDALDIPRTRAGQVVGWYLNKNGDNYIDFGIYDFQNSHFLNGNAPGILLDFNVDGPIIDHIDER